MQMLRLHQQKNIGEGEKQTKSKIIRPSVRAKLLLIINTP